MTKFIFLALFLFSSIGRAGSWYENKNGGFGIYEPLGWTVEENGRSARLIGPETDVATSEIFMGSDWSAKVHTAADLRSYAEGEYGPVTRDLTIDGLTAVQIGDDEHGTWLAFREDENVILITYDLRGSSDQVREGKLSLSSIAIRTGGIESLVR